MTCTDHLPVTFPINTKVGGSQMSHIHLDRIPILEIGLRVFQSVRLYHARIIHHLRHLSSGENWSRWQDSNLQLVHALKTPPDTLSN